MLFLFKLVFDELLLQFEQASPIELFLLFFDGLLLCLEHSFVEVFINWDMIFVVLLSRRSLIRITATIVEQIYCFMIYLLPSWFFNGLNRSHRCAGDPSISLALSVLLHFRLLEFLPMYIKLV